LEKYFPDSARFVEEVDVSQVDTEGDICDYLLLDLSIYPDFTPKLPLRLGVVGSLRKD